MAAFDMLSLGGPTNPPANTGYPAAQPAAAPAPVSNGFGGFDALSGLDALSAMPSPAPSQPAVSQNSGGGLLDMMGSAPAPTPAPAMAAFSAPAPTPAPAVQHPPPNGEPITFLDEPSSIKIIGGVLKNGTGKTQCTVQFLNNGGAQIDNLKFQLAVPKYIQMNMQTPSSTSVAPGGVATQVIFDFE